MTKTTPVVKQGKDAVIRARCASTLKNDIEEIARFKNVDPADIMRHACLDYVARVRQSMRQLAMAE